MSVFKNILKKYWKFDSFRPLQEDIIQNIYSGKDCLALLPTGGGKSICFQVPAMAMDGVCLVISPLIALMNEQVQNLNDKGIKAKALHSGLRRDAIDRILDNCIYGKTKFLYLSPERLQSDLFVARFKQMKISFIAVDEAHCISQWGYDFRPAYLKIADLRVIKPELKILALTATATSKVVIDIQKKLLFEKQNLIQQSFFRKNLSYSVLYPEAKLTKLLSMVKKINSCSIVYVQSRKHAKQISDYLNANEILSTYYHAGLSLEQRNIRQQNWLEEKVKTIVATNAFGMGIDKPNVRLVVHLSLSSSLESYFQEAGRAGRDEKKAYAVLLANDSDKIKIKKIIQNTMPSLEEIRHTYSALATYFQLAIGSGKEQKFRFDFYDFCTQYKLSTLKTYQALKFIEFHQYISLSDEINQPAKLFIRMGKRAFENYINKQTKFKKLLQLVLRSYGGLFDGSTPINEDFLSKKLKISIEAIQNLFRQLVMQQVLYYEPRSSLPFVFFNEARMEENNLNLNQNYIQERIQTFKENHLNILSYVEEKKICRSVQLLNYFGEKDSEKCGVCDVCLGRNKTSLKNKQEEQYILNIKQKLLKNPLKIDDLKGELKVKNEIRFVQVINELIDLGYLQQDENHYLFWTKR